MKLLLTGWILVAVAFPTFANAALTCQLKPNSGALSINDENGGAIEWKIGDKMTKCKIRLKTANYFDTQSQMARLEIELVKESCVPADSETQSLLVNPIRIWLFGVGNWTADRSQVQWWASAKPVACETLQLNESRLKEFAKSFDSQKTPPPRPH